MTDINKAFLSFGLLLFFVSTLLQVSAQQQDVTIKGNFKNWPKQRYLIISYSEGTESVSDTVTVKYGKFSYKKNFLDPTELSLYYDGSDASKGKDSRRLMAVQGKISLKHTDSLKRAIIQGPKGTMEFEILKSQSDPVVNNLVSLRIKAQQILKESGSIPAQLDTDYKAGVSALREVYKSFVRNNPGSMVSLIGIKQLDGANYSDPEIFELYKGLANTVKESSEGIDIQKRFTIGLKTSVGTVLEDFSSLDTTRNPLSLADVKRKGKLTLVDFWASWCKPCRAENPHLRKVFDEFHDSGFNIIAVSLDLSEAAWKNAINQDQLPWYHVSSLQYWDEPIVKQFGIGGVPDSFLLDAEGRIIGRGLRGDKLYQAVKSALTL